MYETYEQYGVRFRYPRDWELTEGAQADGISIQVQSPSSAFWSLNLFPECPAPAVVMACVLEAFRDEYEEVDVYPAQDSLCEHLTVAQDVDFVCRDLINSAWIRTFRTPRFTAPVLYQATDHELQDCRDAFDQISRSLACDDEDDSEDP